MSVSFDERLLATCGLDEHIRLWNIEYLYDIEINERKKVSFLLNIVFLLLLLLFIYSQEVWFTWPP